MATASSDSGMGEEHPRRGKLVAGVLLLAISALPALSFVMLGVDYATSDYPGSGYEDDLVVFLMVVTGIAALVLFVSGLALLRSGRERRPMSRLFHVGLGVLVIGFGVTYIANHTVEGFEAAEVLYGVSLIGGALLMFIGSLLSFGRS